MERAVTILEKHLGGEHPNVATALNNLAQLLQATNRLTEAEPLMHRALAIDEKSFGPDHPNVAIRLSNLAALLKGTNRLVEAEPLMHRALAIDEKSFGPDHPKVAIRLNNLARLLQDTNRLAEAEPLMLRCVTIFLDFTRKTGHEHPGLQTGIGNYFGLLMAMVKSPTEVESTIKKLVLASQK
ncbi:MAG TPA: tetratricopeptide repeat protein [Thermoanaerobaculia bacterium]|nr:tetratricopeptide repeat protein [Thermoanaerobaculia bacterium]